MLRLLDLGQVKTAVLSSLTPPGRVARDRHAIDEFVDWYCSEPRLAFNRVVRIRSTVNDHVGIEPTKEGFKGVGEELPTIRPEPPCHFQRTRQTILQGFMSEDSGVGLVVEDKVRHVIFLGFA